MKKILTFAAILTICAAPAFATENNKTTAQGEKMKACAHEYKSRNLPKSEYKPFIKSCLKKGYHSGSYQSRKTETAPAPVAVKDQPPATANTTIPVKLDPKEKMKKCNSDAQQQNLKGEDRKKFMRSCLSA